MTTVFFDFDSLALSGVDLQTSHTRWPVSPELLSEVRQPLISTYFSLLSNFPEFERDIIFGDTNFFVFFLQYAHYQVAKARVLKAGGTIRAGRSSAYLDPNWDSVAEVRAEYFQNNGIFFREVIQPLKRVRRRLIHKKPRPANSAGGCPKKALGVAAIGVHGAEHSLQQSFFINSLDSYDFWDWRDFRCLPTPTKVATTLEDIRPVQDFVHEFLSFSEKHLAQFGVYLDVNICAAVWCRRLVQVLNIYRPLLDAALPFSEAVVVGENDVFRKPVILALQKTGVRITGFLHGDTLSGIYRQKDAVSLSRSHVATYVAPNQQNALRQSALYCSGGSYSHRDVSYVGLNGGVANGPSDPSKHLNNHSFVLMGWPMNMQAYLDDDHSFFATKFALERQIIMFMRELNLPLYYKPHPDRLMSVKTFLQKEKIPILLDHFEKVIDQHSTFIFTHPTSSTFGRILKTSKSVILFDSAPHLWTEEGAHLIDTRCYRIPTTAPVQSGFMFEREIFRNALEESMHFDARRLSERLVLDYFLR